MAVILYGFWRSMAAYRVRVALNLKGLDYREIPLDLDKGDQFDPGFLAVNPEGAVPALVDGEGPAITQSMAILEYLEERYPAPPLLPADAAGRARVRSICALIASDTHPLLVPRVRSYLLEHGHDAVGVQAWSRHWIGRAAKALEARLTNDSATGPYCHGDQVTLADLCLASLLTLAKDAGYQLTGAPTLTEVLGRLETIDSFQRALPARQAGAPS